MQPRKIVDANGVAQEGRVKRMAELFGIGVASSHEYPTDPEVIVAEDGPLQPAIKAPEREARRRSLSSSSSLVRHHVPVEEEDLYAEPQVEHIDSHVNAQKESECVCYSGKNFGCCVCQAACACEARGVGCAGECIESVEYLITRIDERIYSGEEEQDMTHQETKRERIHARSVQHETIIDADGSRGAEPQFEPQIPVDEYNRNTNEYASGTRYVDDSASDVFTDDPNAALTYDIEEPNLKVLGDRDGLYDDGSHRNASYSSAEQQDSIIEYIRYETALQEHVQPAVTYSESFHSCVSEEPLQENEHTFSVVELDQYSKSHYRATLAKYYQMDTLPDNMPESPYNRPSTHQLTNPTANGKMEPTTEGRINKYVSHPGPQNPLHTRNDARDDIENPDNFPTTYDKPAENQQVQNADNNEIRGDDDKSYISDYDSNQHVPNEKPAVTKVSDEASVPEKTHSSQRSHHHHHHKHRVIHVTANATGAQPRPRMKPHHVAEVLDTSKDKMLASHDDALYHRAHCRCKSRDHHREWCQKPHVHVCYHSSRPRPENPRQSHDPRTGSKSYRNKPEGRCPSQPVTDEIPCQSRRHSTRHALTHYDARSQASNSQLTGYSTDSICLQSYQSAEPERYRRRSGQKHSRITNTPRDDNKTDRNSEIPVFYHVIDASKSKTVESHRLR